MVGNLESFRNKKTFSISFTLQFFSALFIFPDKAISNERKTKVKTELEKNNKVVKKKGNQLG